MSKQIISKWTFSFIWFYQIFFDDQNTVLHKACSYVWNSTVSFHQFLNLESFNQQMNRQQKSIIRASVHWLQHASTASFSHWFTFSCAVVGAFDFFCWALGDSLLARLTALAAPRNVFFCSSCFSICFSSFFASLGL